MGRKSLVTGGTSTTISRRAGMWTKQSALMPDTKPLLEGLHESYEWYREHEDLVNKKPLMKYIDEELQKK